MSKFKVLLLYPNVPGSTLLPLGISSLSASLKEAGIEVELFDATFYKNSLMSNFEKKKEYLLQVKPFKSTMKYKGGQGDMLMDLKKMVNDYQPDLIGISLVEDTIPQGLMMLKAIKDYRPNSCPRVAGGIGVNWNIGILTDSNLIHIICLGEGEEVLVQLIKENKDRWFWFPNDAKSILWRDEDSWYYNTDVRNPLDINELPIPDFTIFEEERIKRVMHGKEYRMLHVEVDRGCPYQCTYCAAPALKKKYGKGYYRRKSVERIAFELGYLMIGYKPDYIDFNSETILSRSMIDLEDLFGGYSQYCKIPFWCQARPEDITEEKIKLLKDAGVADMQIGIEHGNEKFRRKWLKRKGSNKQIIKACHLMEKYDIPYTVNMILFPNLDTRETIFDGIELCRQISPKTINVYHLALYKGTWLHKYYLEQGWITDEDKTNQLLDGSSTLKYVGLTKDEIYGLQRTFPLYVKMPERKAWIEDAEVMDEDGNNMFSLMREEFILRFYE